MAADHIESILPQPPEVSLLTSAYPFPADMAGYDKWGSLGVQSRNIGCMNAYSEATVCADPDRDVYDPAPEDCSSFFPLKSKVSHGKDGNADDIPRWKTETEAALAARLPFFMARELWTGAVTGSASLQSSAEISTTDAQFPVAGIATALADYEECSQGALPFVHAPSVLAPYLEAHAFHERKGDRYHMSAGGIIVPGPGYPNGAGNWGPYQGTRPPGPGEDGHNAGTYTADMATYLDSGAPSAVGHVWVYVSGKVEAATPHAFQTVDQKHPRTNKWAFTASAATIARVDTCCVFAALVKIPGSI